MNKSVVMIHGVHISILSRLRLILLPRTIQSMVNATINAQFTYDHNGLRVKKAVNGITTDYTLNGKLITHMTCGDNELHFFL